MREGILDLLTARFGEVPLEMRERVNSETNLARLRTWARSAGTCAKLEEFSIA